MCGRFTQTLDAGGIQQAFPWITVPQAAQGHLLPRFNVAPSQPVAVVVNDGRNTLDFYNWGLIPSWAKDTRIGYKMINARGETLSEKPSFRNAYKRRRCLLLSDGFYEWKHEGKEKQPVYIHMADHEPFAFAGLWDVWNAPDGGTIRSCTIITTEANDLMADVHNRMPVILPFERYEDWLDPAERKPETLGHHIRAYPSDKMAYYPVSTYVNRPANDGPMCIDPV